MEEEMVVYDGRSVPVQGFRAFVYGPNSTQKLANSWDEYQALISSGIWYSKKSDVKEILKESEKNSKKDK
jgi:hypothetical protein